MNKQTVISTLVKGENRKFVLLFDSTIDIKRFTSRLADDIRAEPTFQPSNSVAFRVAQNMVKVAETTFYLGLRKDEPMLASEYSDDQIAYFEKES